MKKIFTLVLALFAICIGVKANIFDGTAVVRGSQITSYDALTDGSLYVLMGIGDNNYYYEVTTDPTTQTTANAIYKSTTLSPQCVVKINKLDNNKISIQTYSGAYYQGMTTENEQIKVGDNASEFTLEKTGNAFYFETTTSDNVTLVINDNGAQPNAKNKSSYAGNYSKINIYEVTPAYIVTWNIKGVTTKPTTAVAIGAQASTNVPTYAFTTITYTDQEINSDTEISATAEFNTPFTASTSFDAATWYFIQNHSGNGYLQYSSENTDHIIINTSKSYDESYLWAFIGNPIDGYQIINKANQGKYLQQTGSSNGSGDNVITYPNIGGNSYTWQLLQVSAHDNSITDKTWFTFKASDANNYWNNRRYKSQSGTSVLSYWTGFGSGSSWSIENVPSVDELFTDNIAPYYNGDIYPCLNETGKKVLDDAGYESSKTDYTYADYNTIKTAFDNLSSSQDNYDYYPVSGYYRIHNNPANGNGLGYIGVGPNNQSRGNQATGWGLRVLQSGYETDASTVIYLDNVSVDDHTYKLKSQNEWGSTATAASQPVLMTTQGDDASEYTIEPAPDAYNFFVIKQPTATGSRYYFHDPAWGSNGSAVVIWDASASASRWQAEKLNDGDLVYSVALHKGGDNYYATAYLPFPSKITTEGVKAYIGYLNGTNSLKLTEISGTIPANTGVVLVGNAAGNVEFALSTFADAKTTIADDKTISDNQLSGYTIATTIAADGNQLTLGISGGTVGFYHWAGSLTNKAYYEYAGATSKGFAFSFGSDDDPTGISEDLIREAVKELQGQRYNVQGQPVGADYKGIVIQGGKKYLQK